MSTLISARVDEDEAQRLDELATALDMDRASLLRRLIRRAYREEQFERAMQDYRKGEITLSRAGEMTGLSVHDLLVRLPVQKIELNYDLSDWQNDVRAAR